MERVMVVAFDEKKFRLTFDEDGILDTVFKMMGNKPEIQLNGKNRDVQRFVRYQNRLYLGYPVSGITLLSIANTNQRSEASMR